jgi:hypothetical protein
MAAHHRGTAHKFTPEEARAAGRKGGRAARGGVTTGEQGTPPASTPPSSGTSGESEGYAPPVLHPSN